MNLRVLLFKNKPQIRFVNPKKSNLVIYDPVVRDVFREIVSVYNPTYLALSSELYLPIFIRALLKKLLQSEKRLIDLYIFEFLKCVKPVLVGTNFEIDCRFAYYVSNLEWQTFFVQHGNYAGFFVNEEYRNSYKLPNVTDMFVFNAGVKEHLQLEYNYGGNFYVIGSLIANELIDTKCNSNTNAKYLYLVSEWEGSISDPRALAAQEKIITYCQQFCVNQAIILKILLRHETKHSNYEEEIEFYSRVCAGKVEFVSKENKNTNYNSMVNTYGVVFFSSTLGYELALNLNLAVVCISFRATYLNLPKESFGWPIVKDSCGLGFTNVLTYEEVSRVLNDLKQGGISKNLRSKLLASDPSNTTFKAYLEKKLGN
jgi:surface carbohydrate biosynthesis protein